MSLKEYNVGGDDLPLGDMQECDWVVYWYELGGYDGRGLIAWKKGDKYDYEHIGHCSCYGPMADVEGDYASLTAEQLVAELKPISKEDFDYKYAKLVYDKVMKLTRKERNSK
jgi:hypothetical protein